MYARLRTIAPRPKVLVLGLTLGMLALPWAGRAQTQSPTPAQNETVEPAAKPAPAVKPAATPSKPKAPAKKAATPAKPAPKKPAAAKLPETAKAPPPPRQEPFTLAQRDRDVFGEAMRAVEARQWSRALDAVGRSGTPLLKKIVTWAYIREPGNHVTFSERAAFVADNPNWPGVDTIQRRAEESLDDTFAAPALLVDWFATHRPLTASGRAAYARALMSSGKTEEAKTAAREVWRTGVLDRNDERAFVGTFGTMFTPDDERERLDRLLYAEETVAAERQIARVDPATAALARARMALITAKGNVDALIAAVPQTHRSDPGLIYDRVKWRRRQGKNDEARALLPPHPDRGARPDLMWTERYYLAREALNAGLVSEAYAIVKNHGDISALDGLADAEWFAGWIALRFLKDGEAALVHFESVYDKVQVPANIAKGAYWTGRAAEFLGRPDIAADWYRRAATHVTTYYGQLALSRLKADPIPALSDDPVPTQEDRNAFESAELTKAARALADVHNKTHLRTFVLAIADTSRDAAQRHLAAQFADRVGHPEMGVELSRASARTGIPLLQYGFPIPTYPIPAEPERAFVLGISRQESNFNSNTRSTAGALGIMQLLPSTAKDMARRQKITFTQSKLTSDPAYNVRLGTAFLDSLVDNYDGSYVLAATAYNAGPGRARQWIRQFGDPRDGQTDPIDWVEQIPFAETRAYVQRVMENMMVYRARLANTRVIGSSLESELVRARPGG